jgi:hypothetical protein
MTISDCIAVIAILLGPILAVQIHQHLDRLREIRRSKEEVFRVLMATRGNLRSHEHMQALNSIEVAFYGARPGDVRVTLASRAYLRSLRADGDQGDLSQRTEDLFGDLLTTVATNLGFDIPRMYLVSSAKKPSREHVGLIW